MVGFSLYINTFFLASVFQAVTVSASGGCLPNIPEYPFHYVLRKHYVIFWRLMDLKTTFTKDGDPFLNREMCLPDGCYKKFTLLYEKWRPSRLVISCDGRNIFYSFDHYQSFTKISDFSLGLQNPRNL